MDIFRIEDSGGANAVETPRLKSGVRWCIFYKEEVCSAPRIRFKICRTCCRIDPRLALRSLLDKIKELAAGLFNLQDIKPEPPLPGQ